MGDIFYNSVWTLGVQAFYLSSDPVVLHRRHTARRGAYILAANHRSPFDIPLLMRHSHRQLDFVSIVELFRIPVVGWLYGNMNAFPLDRSKKDGPTVRTMLDRLARGRVVAMFPEGRIRPQHDTVTHGGEIRTGVGRLAVLGNVPIVPAVLINSNHYEKFENWLPINCVSYGVAFGPPLFPRKDLDRAEAGHEIEQRFKAEMVRLYAELSGAMGTQPRRRAAAAGAPAARS